MKSMAKTILFGGVILAAQAATADGLAFPSASDDAGNTLAARVTYVDTLRNDGLVSVAPGFPSSAPDGVFLPANVARASEYASNPVAVNSAFPSSVDDAGIQLTARSTYADTHLDRSMQAYRPMQGIDTGN